MSPQLRTNRKRSHGRRLWLIGITSMVVLRVALAAAIAFRDDTTSRPSAVATQPNASTQPTIAAESALTGDDLLTGFTRFMSYALGMATVVVALTVALGLVGALRRIIPYVQAASAVLLIVAGSTIVLYWLPSVQNRGEVAMRGAADPTTHGTAACDLDPWRGSHLRQRVGFDTVSRRGVAYQVETASLPQAA